MAKMLYSVPEVADILQCNQNYVHELRKAGLLPFLKLGRYKCRHEALQDFLTKYEGKDLTDPKHIVDL